MKKLVIFLVILFVAVTVISCGDKAGATSNDGNNAVVDNGDTQETVSNTANATNDSSDTQEPSPTPAIPGGGFDINDYRLITDEGLDAPFVDYEDGDNNLTMGQTDNPDVAYTYTLRDLFEEFGWEFDTTTIKGRTIIKAPVYLPSEMNTKVHGAMVMSPASEQDFLAWKDSGEVEGGLPQMSFYCTYQTPNGEWLALELTVEPGSIDYPIELMKVGSQFSDNFLLNLAYEDYDDFFYAVGLY